jgi:hypothetical protein
MKTTEEKIARKILKYLDKNYMGFDDRSPEEDETYERDFADIISKILREDQVKP